MSKKDLLVRYEFDNESTPEEVESRLARAYDRIFRRIEKNGVKLDEKKIPQLTTK